MKTEHEDIAVRLLREGENAQRKHLSLGMWQLCSDAAGEIYRLRDQLPEGMKHCTIQFKECEKGHGRLTATNWVQHGCLQCEIDRLRSGIDWQLGQTEETK